jgi:cyanophycin synthetase
LYAQLVQSGLHAGQLRICLDEVEAVRSILEWAQNGDVLALPVHGLQEREAVQALLDAMQMQDWQPGQTLPILANSANAIE